MMYSNPKWTLKLCSSKAHDCSLIVYRCVSECFKSQSLFHLKNKKNNQATKIGQTIWPPQVYQLKIAEDSLAFYPFSYFMIKTERSRQTHSHMPLCREPKLSCRSEAMQKERSVTKNAKI